MNLQPSKLSVTANQVWEESSNLFKKDDVKVDLGLDKMLKKSSNLSIDKKDFFSPGYIFGSKLTERVIKPKNDNNVESSTDKKINKTIDASSIFKKMANSSTQNLWKTNKNSEVDSSNHDRLKASIEEFEKKSQSSAEITPIEPITTGEENEQNIANINCKFFQYNIETKSWIEKGMGALKLNRNKTNKDELRLIGRITGNQRVIINSKLFAGMILEQLSEKRLKISALNSDADLPQLFIINASPLSIASIQTLLEKYITRLQAQKTEEDESNKSFTIRKRKQSDCDEEDIEPNKKSINK